MSKPTGLSIFTEESFGSALPICVINILDIRGVQYMYVHCVPHKLFISLILLKVVVSPVDAE